MSVRRPFQRATFVGRSLAFLAVAAAIALTCVLEALLYPHWQSAMLISLGLGGFIGANIWYQDLLSPVGVFFASWFVPLGVSQLYLSGLQQRFDSTTWTIVLGSAAAFVLGCCAGAAISPSSNKTPAADLAAGISSTRLRRAIYGLLALALCGFVYEARASGGLPALSDEPTVAYATFAQSYVHYLAVSAISVALLAIGHLRLFPRKRVGILVLIIALSIGILLSLLARLQLFIVIIGAAVIWNYSGSKPLRLSSIALILGVLLVAMDIIGNFRVGRQATGFAQTIGLLNLPSWADAASWPYLYLALNFEQLRTLLHSNYPQSWGAFTLMPLLSFTFTRHLLPAQSVEQDLGWFNTMTYLWVLYQDFREFGVAIVPFCYGLGATWLYGRLRSAPSLSIVLLHCLALFCIAFAFFYNFFAFPLTYVLAAEVWFVGRYARTGGDSARGLNP